MRFLSVNLDSFLIELNSLEETLALYRQLQQLGHPDIREMIPAAQTILVYFDRWKIQAKVLMDWIASSLYTIRHWTLVVSGWLMSAMTEKI